MGTKVCVIGAGPSGLISAKYLKENGISFKCFEKKEDLGGLWRYDPQAESGIYQSLHINTSRQKMEMSDFPFPDDYPIYPHHSLIYSYFKDYASHFGIDRSINFKTEVEQVLPYQEGSWKVRTSDGQEEIFSHVIVANGHHWDPKIPHLKGKSSSECLHASKYRTPLPFSGKRVLILGIGNSAIDIACELSSVAKSVAVSTRRSAYIFPKYIMGKPLDHWNSSLSNYIPRTILRFFFNLLLRVAVGRPEDYGLPRPKYKIDQMHPAISSDFLPKIGHGKIKIFPQIERCEGNSVYFEDGRREEFDTLIFATGYNIRFPFFESSVLKVEDQRIDLFLRVLSPALKNVFFVGLVQPLGAIFPLAEWQAKWICGMLTGKNSYPHIFDMEEGIRKQVQQNSYFVQTPRHFLEEDYYSYIKNIKREMRRSEICQ